MFGPQLPTCPLINLDAPANLLPTPSHPVAPLPPNAPRPALGPQASSAAATIQEAEAAAPRVPQPVPALQSQPSPLRPNRSVTELLSQCTEEGPEGHPPQAVNGGAERPGSTALLKPGPPAKSRPFWACSCWGPRIKEPAI